MAKQLQLRRGTATEHDTFTGANGEVTVDTTNKTLRVHDGSTVGGTRLATSADIINYLPLAYPKSTPPSGYLVMMGQAISQATYPKLYALYGTTLPDLRGKFLRGLDYGRGIDVDRAVLSEQGDAIRNITGSVGASSGNKRGSWEIGTSTGALRIFSSGTGNNAAVNEGTSWGFDFDASLVVPTANEVRVKNIAFLYIVKAG